MKRIQSDSARASSLQITISVALLSGSAILFASSFRAALARNASTSPLALGSYPDTSAPLSTNTTVTPDAAPTDTTSINVSASTSFKGTFAGNPATGVLRVTDAHPAGRYTVTVRAFNSGDLTATRTFTLTVTTPNTCTPAFFAPATNYDAGPVPSQVVIGDFNGDGKQDLATADYSGNSVAISLGDGAGSFGALTYFSSGGVVPISLAVGDFNGDGKQDLAVANAGTTNVAILLGNGSGSFTVAGTYVASNNDINFVAVGDFNNDGKQDLVTANTYGMDVSVFLGDGTGNFSTARHFPAGSHPLSIALGDFNGDGNQDLAVVNNNSNNVSILLGDGAGQFSAPTNYNLPTDPLSVAAGDFNGDGKQDLVVANGNSNNVSLLLGDGAGHFGPATNFALAGRASWIAIGDFNGDGNQDLAVPTGASDTSILLGDGTGNFSTPSHFLVGSYPDSVAVGDFNGDGKQDLAVSNYSSNSDSVLLRVQCPTPTPSPAPITITVTTINDSGPGSLRQALAGANHGDIIQFDPLLNGQTITLTSTELVINRSITITGPGLGLLRILRNQQAPNFRIFSITTDQTVAISGLTISGGSLANASGGGIMVDHATLTITNCAISGNGTSAGTGVFAGGGGIYNNNGTLSLINSTVTGNSAAGGWSSGGGGISSAGSLTIIQSSISGNNAIQGGGGIACSGKSAISDSTVSNNQTSNLGHFGGNGGGIANGGTLTIQNSVVTGNSAAGEAYGGQGGGITNSGSAEITNCTLSGNTSNWGGGLYGWSRVTNSTISGNNVQFDGGGIYTPGIVSNSTISGNNANHNGGGTYGGGTITNSTISSNTAHSLGGGIYANTQVVLGNTILKTGAAGANIFNNSTVTSQGYNLSSDNGSGVLTGPGDQINTDPMLGPLQSNGGPTSTHALLPGSPAIDTGDPTFTPPPSTDQRGYPRVSNPRIDIGSFEVQVAPTPTPTPTPTPCLVLYDQTTGAGGGGVVSQNFEAVNNTYDAQAADDFVVPVMQNWMVEQVKVSGMYFNGPGPAASVNVTFYFDAANFPGAVVGGGTFNSLSMSDTAGSFTIPLPTNLVLTAGTYWVSVQANIDFNPFGEWAWSDRTVTSNSPAAWQNPGGGFATSCTTYGRRGANCGIDPTAPDQVFQILGCTVATTPITISGTVSYCSNPVPGPVPNVTFTLSGSASGISSSDVSGNYLFSVPPGGSYTVTPAKTALTPGSAGINTTDVVATQRHFLMIGTPLSGCRLTAADVNRDNAINTTDVIAIQRFFLVQSTGTANTGEYQFNPVNRSYPGVVSNQTNQNYDALVLGDVVTPFVH